MKDEREEHEEFCVHTHFEVEFLLSIRPEEAAREINFALSTAAIALIRLVEQKRADRDALERLIGG